jgi:hypothetical protein
VEGCSLLEQGTTWVKWDCKRRRRDGLLCFMVRSQLGILRGVFSGVGGVEG